MSKPTTCKEAILRFCDAQPEPKPKPEDLAECLIFYEHPCIEKMDPSLGMLKNCKKLSLSSNNIDKIAYLSGLQLEIFSIGRNSIRKLDGVEAVKDTLQELWISYNNIDKLTVLTNYQFPNLRRIYCSCNAISSWNEIENLQKIESLQEVAFAGNPLPNYSPQEVFNRLPKLLRVDGFSQDMLLKKMGVSNAPATQADTDK